MRKRTLGAILLAGLAVSGASAFTGSNTYNNGTASTIAGYGASTATGATIENISYTTAADPSKLASVVFTSSTNVTGKTATMTLRDGSGTVVGSPYTCSLGTYTAYVAATASGGQTITCLTGTNPAIASFTSVGLTVVQ